MSSAGDAAASRSALRVECRREQGRVTRGELINDFMEFFCDLHIKINHPIQTEPRATSRFSLYSFLSGHILLQEKYSMGVLTRLFCCPLALPLSPSPFSQALTIEPFMWPHFETWRRGSEWARGDTKKGGAARWSEWSLL